MKTLVYLDHLIQRDGLLYERSGNQAGDIGDYRKTLLIRDLENSGQRALLRKPDFQRATYAWSPKDCVDLLEAVLTEQVVPSVILWLDSYGSQYVLDGGHRISVLLAWIKNDWGDGPEVRALGDEHLEEAAKEAADQVRDLLKERRIGTFEEHKQAINVYESMTDSGRDPKVLMADSMLMMANNYRRWQSVEAGFPILWVRGDYQKAEESFLAINKSGQRLSEWETALVENRTGAFARVVMSIAFPNRARHCWPSQDLSSTEKAHLQVTTSKITEIRKRLFEYPYLQPIRDYKQPLLGHPAAQPDSGPTYVAEILTVVEGRRGLPSDTRDLLQRDKSSQGCDVIKNAERLTSETLEGLDNIYGPSPRSLSIMPLVYCYNGEGQCVRALLYGFLHWIISGTETQITNRKFAFTYYRRSFEAVLLTEKRNIVARFSRRIGSGGEVTLQLGRYFNGLLQLLIAHGGECVGTDFSASHAILLESSSLKKQSPSSVNSDAEPVKISQSRFYSGTVKKRLQVETIVKGLSMCEICGGYFYPGSNTQIDHNKRYRDGGQTSVENGRFVHPFCNNNRDRIERLQSGEEKVELPDYGQVRTENSQPQLNFFENLFFDAPAPWMELQESDAPSEVPEE
ncbi:DUF262 domain-containing protein [Phragmitibacter flavus]|uniref:DUF262 domain-containing protein n=1 Tax=Phragmitibacter flavus TaxID=2576071 RepID=A0A5R8KGP9_9BACT|nr:DUF262 domain-containing protein [Phragmitibacter flavus]TLD71488.1 DUF262 domain-containing protein [Phragmitibacter flavus]